MQRIAGLCDLFRVLELTVAALSSWMAGIVVVIAWLAPALIAVFFIDAFRESRTHVQGGIAALVDLLHTWKERQ